MNEAYLEDEVVRFKNIMNQAEAEKVWLERAIRADERLIKDIPTPAPTFSIASSFIVTPSSLVGLAGTMFKAFLP